LSGSPPALRPAELASRALGEGFGLDRRRRAAVALVLDKILRRRRWALHRHVHLVAAFEEASARAPVGTMLGVGCGLGLTELYLAATHPEVEVVLSDHDPERLQLARYLAWRYRITNASFLTVDLLASAPALTGRFDLVTGVEVLEHVEDDQLAFAHLAAMSRRHVFQLVPACTEAALVDPRVRARVWEHQQHHRPGYTERTLAELVAPMERCWMRPCYLEPQASALRAEMTGATDAELVADRRRLVDAVVAEIGAVAPSAAAGASVDRGGVGADPGVGSLDGGTSTDAAASSGPVASGWWCWRRWSLRRRLGAAGDGLLPTMPFVWWRDLEAVVLARQLRAFPARLRRRLGP
jgi:SAM-dependent methyltransferase